MDERQLTNIVFMGMGEPLYNLDNVAAALDIISDNEGIAISRRRITVSTSGVVPQLKALGERTGAMLAISLHATRDELRDRAGADQPPLSDRRADGRDPRLSGPLERQAGDLRIRDAEGRQRHARPTPRRW